MIQDKVINQNRLVREFSKLVSIDSLSFQERNMADYLTEELENLGFCVVEDKAGDVYDGNAGNLYALLQGDLKGEPILFSSHMDTVVPGIGKKAVVHEDGKITSDGTTILGADCLSGVVSILEAIKVLKENKIAHRSIELLLPIAEEVYLKGSNVFDYSMIQAKEAYTLDLSGRIGIAALSAPTVVSITAKFIGKAAHAGFAPESGINSIAMAAKGISLIDQGTLADGSRVNIGKIEGGLARNIVSEECTLLAEVRSLSHDRALEISNELHEVFEKVANEAHGKLEYNTSFGCIAYKIEENESVVTAFEEVCTELNIKSEFISTFGGSDNNNFVNNGIRGIVIACGMNDVHSTNEYTSIDDLTKTTNIVMKLMTREVKN